MHYLGKEQVCTQGERHGTCNGPGSSVRGMGGTPRLQKQTRTHRISRLPGQASRGQLRLSRGGIKANTEEIGPVWHPSFAKPRRRMPAGPSNGKFHEES